VFLSARSVLEVSVDVERRALLTRGPGAGRFNGLLRSQQFVVA